MNFQAAITAQLTAEIAAFCKIDAARAARELSAAKKVAKTMGLTVAETLHHLGLVG